MHQLDGDSFACGTVGLIFLARRFLMVSQRAAYCLEIAACTIQTIAKFIIFTAPVIEGFIKIASLFQPFFGKSDVAATEKSERGIA
ncbi:hypothetical protein VL04_13300 [Chromobacterium violaceum]|nr:hypothetical protein VK93_05745 [Chromobacterium violaceum]KMN85239.1 hypothetical protein VL02_15320 [Chromobacterium violaceum]KMN89508.1 hypothetical protein VL04_13300 [Chromobacterium violaceum]KMO03550.1 hypothetical protein VL16_11055 [Chromobacterium violaceum]